MELVTEETSKNEENSAPDQQENNISDVNMPSDMLAAKIKEKIEKLSNDCYKCLVCGFNSNYKQSIVGHAETHIEGLEYTCKYCKKIVKTRNHLSNHISTNHREERKAESSKAAESLTRVEEPIKLNEKKISGNEQQTENIFCTNCNEHFETEITLRLHQTICKIQTDASGEPESDYHLEKAKEMVEKLGDSFKCIICEYSSSFKSNVIRHTEIHVEGFNYSCKYCPLKVKTRNNLNGHISSHHREERIAENLINKLDSCSGPIKKSKTDSNLSKDNMDTEYFNKDVAENIDNNPKTPAKIKVSSEEDAKEKIKDMMKKVDGVVSCLQCTHSSTTKEAMSKHILSKHLEGITYKCNFCGKTYSSKGSLQVHRSIYHRG